MIGLIGLLDQILKLIPGNKLKTLLGAVITILGALIGFVNDILPVLPEYPMLDQALLYLSIALDYAEQIATFLGYSFMGVGVSHKVVKKYSHKDEATKVLS